jgi:hypothetical protein
MNCWVGEPSTRAGESECKLCIVLFISGWDVVFWLVLSLISQPPWPLYFSSLSVLVGKLSLELYFLLDVNMLFKKNI